MIDGSVIAIINDEMFLLTRKKVFPGLYSRWSISEPYNFQRFGSQDLLGLWIRLPIIISEYQDLT